MISIKRTRLILTGVLAMIVLMASSQQIRIKGKKLIYKNPAAKSVVVAGDWNNWAGSAINAFDLTKDKMNEVQKSMWQYDLSGLKAGRHEYKLIVDGNWESGGNRSFVLFSLPKFDDKKTSSPYIVYDNPDASAIAIAGDWNRWAGNESGKFDPTPYQLKKNGKGQWIYPVKDLAPGQHQFKFIIDGGWEGGDNRVVFVNSKGMRYDPKEYIYLAQYTAPDTIELVFPDAKTSREIKDLKFSPKLKMKEITLEMNEEKASYTGYYCDENYVYFKFDSALFNRQLQPNDSLYIAGDFNGWNEAFTPEWLAIDPDQNGIYWLKIDICQFDKTKKYHFSFVINQTDWIEPASQTPNQVTSSDSRTFFVLEPTMEASSYVRIQAKKALDLSVQRQVILEQEDISRTITPSDQLFANYFISNKEMGVTLKEDSTIFRIFSPRASKVKIHIFADAKISAPESEYKLKKDEDGVWSYEADKNLIGKYYACRVSGPDGPGERFDASKELADLYSLCNVQHDGRSLIIGKNYTDDVFDGWEDKDFEIPAQKDLVIYEASLRDLTADKSCPIKDENKGKFMGLVDTLNTEVGLPYLKELGINAIEFLPLHEFDDYPYGAYHWGYMSTLFFSPEASYASNSHGKQVTECKEMVNTLHKEGLAVIMDVVYNHTGSPHYYTGFDNKYYYRLTEDFSNINFSGCGNDVKTESPMMRKMIVDSIVYWIEEYHIDGFRFDLGELIDKETLREVYTAAKKANPDVIMILEPWSFRGNLKGHFKDLDYAYWNDDFRNEIKRAIGGSVNKSQLKKVIGGSKDLWAAKPIHTVNYLSSHDDYTLIDELTSRPHHDGRNPTHLDQQRSMLGAFCTFMSLGVPMISQGQELLYSRKGTEHAYNAGDEVNSIKWENKERFAQVHKYYRDLIAFRQSDEAKPFRLHDQIPQDYILFMDAMDNPKGLGYFLNPYKQQDGSMYMVLINFDDKLPASFLMDSVEGSWKTVFDGNGYCDESAEVLSFEEELDAELNIPPMTGFLLKKIK